MSKEFQLIREETMYRGYLDVMKGIIEIQSEREGKPVQITREVVYKNDAIAVLLHNTDTDEFIFTQQFRYPTAKHNNGYILEIPAGAIDGDEDPIDAVKRELLEETGYQVKNSIEHLSTTYVSPGYSTERTHLYYATVQNSDRVTNGGGVQEETEEITVIPIPVDDIQQKMGEQIVDAKSLLAIQWYQLNKA